MTKHTPRPWKIEESGITMHPISGERAREFIIVATDNSLPNIGAVYGRLDRENIANARLIAAAPELLEALKQCITDHGALGYDRTAEYARKRLDYITEIARAAIAKAEEG